MTTTFQNFSRAPKRLSASFPLSHKKSRQATQRASATLRFVDQDEMRPQRPAKERPQTNHRRWGITVSCAVFDWTTTLRYPSDSDIILFSSAIQYCSDSISIILPPHTAFNQAMSSPCLQRWAARLYPWTLRSWPVHPSNSRPIPMHRTIDVIVESLSTIGLVLGCLQPRHYHRGRDYWMTSGLSL